MTQNNFITYTLAALFVTFMGQITLGLGTPEEGGFGAAFSGNYTFLFFPLVYFLKDRKIKLLPGDIQIAFYIFCVIFFTAWFLQYSYWHLSLRKLISFIIFMSNTFELY